MLAAPRLNGLGAPPVQKLAEIEVPAGEFRSVRVHAISDIHVDYKKNLDWFAAQCARLAAPAKRDGAYSILLIPVRMGGCLE